MPTQPRGKETTSQLKCHFCKFAHPPLAASKDKEGKWYKKKPKAKYVEKQYYGRVIARIRKPVKVYGRTKQHLFYLIDVKNAEELQKDLSERLETDFTGRKIDISKMFCL